MTKHKNIPLPQTEEKDAQIATITSMQNKHPDWKFAMCRVCRTWCVVRKEWDGMHLWCYTTEKKKKRRKQKDPNQSEMI